MRLLTVLVTLLGLAASAGADEIKVLMWSDYIDPEIVQQFEKETGTSVKIDVYEETEAMIAKLQTAGGASQYDLVVASDHAVPILAKLGLVRKLDLAKIPNSKNVDKRFLNPPYDKANDYSLPYQWGTVGLMYNKKKIKTAPTSWAAIIGEGAKPGTFLLVDNMRDMMGIALRLSGASVNAVSKEELQKAGQLILAGKKSDRCVGFDGSVSSAKRLVAGEVDMAIVYNGDGLNAIGQAPEDQQADFDYVIPSEGSIIWVDTMLLTSAGPNPAGATKFMNYILDAKVGAQLSNYINYATPNAAAMPQIVEESRTNPRIYPPAATIDKLEYLQDVGKATQIYDLVWTSVKTR